MSNSEQQPRGVIYDVGYRPYEGAYRGRIAAMASMAWDDFKRGLGVKRTWKYKIWIYLLLLFEIGIGLFFLLTGQFVEQVVEATGVPEALVGEVFEIFRFSQFYDMSTSIIWFLCALVAPFLLCNDRKFNVYQLYLSRPIHSYDYLIAKAAAIFGILAMIVIVPGVLIFAGNLILAEDPMAYFGDNNAILLAMLGSGAVICFFYTSYSMAISSLTTSRSYAIGFILGLVILAGVLQGTLIFVVQDQWVQLFQFTDSVLRVNEFIFHGSIPYIDPSVAQQGPSIAQGVIEAGRPMDAWIYFVEVGAVILISWAIVLFSYRREIK